MGRLCGVSRQTISLIENGEDFKMKGNKNSILFGEVLGMAVGVALSVATDNIVVLPICTAFGIGLGLIFYRKKE